MASTDDIPVLVRRLRSSSRVAQAQAAKAVQQLAQHGGPVAADAVVAAGGIALLTSLLRGGNQAAQAAAVCALHFLAGESMGARTGILAAGGVPALVRLLNPSISTPPDTLWFVPGLLVNLVHKGGADPIPAFVAAGGVPLLVGLLSHSNKELRVSAFLSVQFLVPRTNASAASAFLAAGGLQAVMECLLSDCRSEKDLLFNAAACLGSLTSTGSSSRGEIVLRAAKAGAIPRLMQLLSSTGDEQVRLAAGAALHGTSDVLATRQEQPSAAVRAALEESGGAAAAARLLCDEIVAVQVAGAALVPLLVRCDTAAIAGCVAAGAVPALGQLLSRGELDIPEIATSWWLSQGAAQPGYNLTRSTPGAGAGGHDA